MDSNAAIVAERQPVLVSFSGLDGTGKSTQIQHLVERLRSRGLRVTRYAFWDDVVVGKRYREDFVHVVYGSEKGVGKPGRPVNRQDKNVRKWYLSFARHFLYLMDAVHLCEVLARARRHRPDVIIMDRYIYDELANLPLGNPVSRGFVRLVESFVPRPHVAFLLDVDAETAHARKPEYSVDFMRKSRKAYLRLARMLRTMTVIPPLPLPEARHAVLEAFDNAMERAPEAEMGPAAA